MKKIGLILSCIIISSNTFSQLKVVPSGVVGIKTSSPSSSWGLTIGGNLAGGVIHYNAGYYLRFGQSSANNAVIGSSCDQIDFWTSASGHNVLKAQQFYTTSDRTLKENITPLKSALDIILQLKTYTYNWKEDVINGKDKLNYGFIAQEIKEILPNIVSESQGLLSLEYDAIIPFLVKAMQQQNKLMQSKNTEIEKLKEDISDIKKLLFKVGSHAGMDLTFEKLNETAILYQNQPNPFNENTVIKYELPEIYNSASIMIFDMTGVLLQTHNLTEQTGEITISANNLNPGMYMYSLIVDNIEVDTKRMILQR